MSDKKNIDRLFQEKFKDFEANPAEDFWNDIEARLEEKKRKRAIPFWWKFSGVAAVFLVGIFIGNRVLNNDITPANPVVIEDNSNQNQRKNNDGVLENEATNSVTSRENTNSTEAVSEKDGKTNTLAPKTASSVEAIVNKSKTDDRKSSEKIKSPTMVNDSKSTIALEKSGKNRSSKNKSNSDQNKNSINETVLEKTQNDPLAISKERNNQTIPNNPIAQTNEDKNKVKDVNSLQINKDLNLDGLKGDNNSKIVLKEIENKINDTTKNNSVAKNELEELLTKKEEKLKQESKLNRWQLTSNVAPIFLGSASNGSPIDSTLVNNSKSYNTGVGFGIGVSYAVSKKLTVRTGLNKFNMSYNTNDIIYFAGMESRTLKHINATASSAMIQIHSAATGNSVAPSETGLLPFEDSFVNKNKGYINQEMGYLEIPVEMTYALLDKKFGIKIIGGFSTLFLQDNAVNVVSDNRSTFLGEADNLNNVHFSTNLGIGLKYGFMKSFEFNVEPTFKYQLNTFSSDAGNFKPYVFGIYSGVSYKF